MTSNVALDTPAATLAALREAIGGTPREGQDQATEFMTRILTNEDTSNVGMVESPPGTGKSFAALVAAYHGGTQVVYATHSKALQDQLKNDLTIVSDLVARHSGDFTWAVLKGRSNYICKAKLNPDASVTPQDTLFDPVAPVSALGAEFLALREWSARTDTGDRSEAPRHTAQAWAQVSTTADDCTKKACPFYEECFAVQAQRKAATADVILMNHALLAAALKNPGLLPDEKDTLNLIIDEAHEFEDVIGEAFGATITQPRTKALADRCKGLAKHDSSAERRVDSYQSAMNSLWSIIGNPHNADRQTIQRDDVRQLLDLAVAELQALHRISQATPVGSDQEKAQQQILNATITNLVNDLALVRRGHDDRQVAWAETVSGRPVIRSAQYDASTTIQEHVLDAFNATVMMSATLAVGNDFTYHLRSCGADPDTPTLITTSPFDFPNMGGIVFAEGIPLKPKRPRFNASQDEKKQYETARGIYYDTVASECADYITAAGGRTLVVCTSKDSVVHIGDRLTHQIPTPILRTGEDIPTQQVVQEFASTAESSLIGTRGVGTGVDVSGSALCVVVIESIPFAQATDPIYAARCDKAGKEWFTTIALPTALRALKQWAGRLIRSTNDRGVLVICDPRLNPTGPDRKSYATAARRVLPPLPIGPKSYALEWLTRLNKHAPPVKRVASDEPLLTVAPEQAA